MFYQGKENAGYPLSTSFNDWKILSSNTATKKKIKTSTSPSKKTSNFRKMLLKMENSDAQFYDVPKNHESNNARSRVKRVAKNIKNDNEIVVECYVNPAPGFDIFCFATGSGLNFGGIGVPRTQPNSMPLIPRLGR